MAKKPRIEDGGSKIETTGDVTLSAPLLLGKSGYRQVHLDLQINAQQSAALRALYDGLDERGERLANGSRVRHACDAVRWLLEQLAVRWRLTPRGASMAKKRKPSAASGGGGGGGGRHLDSSSNYLG